jgi:hypothetical protein
MKRILGIGIAVLLAGTAQAEIVFQDDFSTSQGAGWTTTGAIGTSGWNVNRGGAVRGGEDWGARISTNVMDLSNDASANANNDGWVFAKRTLSDTSLFKTTLSSSSGEVTWSFNMQQIRDNPAGFSPANAYGVAFILSANSTNINSTGTTGYAIVLGQSGTTDPLRLAHFTNGVQGTLSNIITANSPLNDVGLEHLSIKVTYNPADNGWTLSGRSDGTSFSDPLSGTLSSLGSATDSTYTGVSLPFMGGYWQGSTAANQNAKFDNVVLSVIPEPASFGLLALGAIGVRLIRRRRV